jgi:hypothetical protein
VLLNMNISENYDLVLEEVYLEYRTQGEGEMAQSFSPRQRHYSSGIQIPGKVILWRSGHGKKHSIAEPRRRVNERSEVDA